MTPAEEKLKKLFPNMTFSPGTCHWIGGYINGDKISGQPFLSLFGTFTAEELKALLDWLNEPMGALK